MKKPFAITLVALAIGSFAAPAFAQGGRFGGPRMMPVQVQPQMPMQMQMPMRNNELRDDARDLRRFERLTMRFDAAVNSRDAASVRGVLAAFVQAGREEVAELQGEAQTSQSSFRRGGSQRWRGRRDFSGEFARLQRATAVLQELESASQAAYNWGPQIPILNRVRQAMSQFVQLAREELQASQYSEIRR